MSIGAVGPSGLVDILQAKTKSASAPFDSAAVQDKHRDNAQTNGVNAAVDPQAGQSAAAQAASASTLVRTQIIAQSAHDAEQQAQTAMQDKSTAQQAIDEFMNFAEMTPEEKMRHMILQSLGLTEEDLQRMGTDQRLEIEKKIAARMEELMKRKIEGRE